MLQFFLLKKWEVLVLIGKTSQLPVPPKRSLPFLVDTLYQETKNIMETENKMRKVSDYKRLFRKLKCFPDLISCIIKASPGFRWQNLVRELHYPTLTYLVCNNNFTSGLVLLRAGSWMETRANLCHQTNWTGMKLSRVGIYIRLLDPNKWKFYHKETIKKNR